MSLKETVIVVGVGYAAWRISLSCISAVFPVLAFLFIVVYPLSLIFPTPERADPPPLTPERRAALDQEWEIKRNKELAEPNIQIVALEKAIANRNTSEIDRLYSAAILSISDHRIGQSHLVIRDIAALRKIVATSPVDIPGNISSHTQKFSESSMRDMLETAESPYQKAYEKKLRETAYEKKLRETGNKP